MRNRSHTIAHLAQVLAIIIATAIAGAFATATPPIAGVAASQGSMVFFDVLAATEEVLVTVPAATRPVGSGRPAGMARSVARLTMPPGAYWEARAERGSLLLTVASGGVKVTVADGAARVARRSGANPLLELSPGESATLFPSDRLAMQGRGSLLAQNISRDPAVAAVIRVT